MRRTFHVSVPGRGPSEKQLGPGGEQLDLRDSEGQPIAPAPRRTSNPMDNAFELTPFVPAPEVKAIAEDLISQFHSERWKELPQIVYLFSLKAPKAHGEDATATCRKVSGLNAYLMRLELARYRNPDATLYNQETHALSYQNEPDFALPDSKHVVKAKPLFVITWHWAAWQFADEDLRIAVTDHELYHVGVDFAETGEGMRYHIIPHTIEEFDVIAARYGAYGARLKMFQKALAEGERERRSR